MVITQRPYLSEFPHGLMFHRFHDRGSRPAGQGSITSDEFERILSLVGIENIFSPEEWLFRLKTDKLSPGDLCLTFDDSLKCQYDICLPVLEKYGLKGFWFINSAVCEGGIEKFEIYNNFGTRHFDDMNGFFELFFQGCGENILATFSSDEFRSFSRKWTALAPFYTVNDLKFRFLRDEVLSVESFESIMDGMMDKKGVKISDISGHLWLSNSDLKDLIEKGHYIGLHSFDHPARIARLSYAEQFDQYLRNLMHLKRVCGGKIVSTAHPYNSYNKDTLKVLRQFGILCGFRANMVPPAGNGINPNSLEIAREDPVNILREYPGK